MTYFVYILVSVFDNSLYTGQTNNLRERIRLHNKKLIRSTRAKVPYKLGYYEVYATRSEAMWREWELKKKYSTKSKKVIIQEFDQGKISEIMGL